MLSAIMVTLDVIARKFFSVTMSGSDEISGYVFAASTTWAYSYCLLHRANVRIDALYNVLSPRAKAILDFIGIGLLTFYIYLLTFKAIFVFTETIEYNATAQTTLATPLWIPQIFWLGGLVFFFVTLVFLTIYALVAFVRNDLTTVALTIGVRDVAQELQDETRGTGVLIADSASDRGEH